MSAPAVSSVPHAPLSAQASNDSSSMTTATASPLHQPNQQQSRLENFQRPRHPPPGYLYGGAVCRIDFWARMTSALGVTQLVIGAGCILFYLMVIYSHSQTVAETASNLQMTTVQSYIQAEADSEFRPPSFATLLHLAGVGLATGMVVSSAGVVGTVASKKKSKFMVCAFLALSILSGVCAMFPLVVGILQAASQHNMNLLLPICELVFGTVEMVVATWSIGVCCQAMCCPNITFGHVTARPMAGCNGSNGTGSCGSGGHGITHFLVSGDGRHVVMLAPQPHAYPGGGHTDNNPPPPYGYSIPAQHAPYVLQNGMTVLPLVSWPRVTGGAIVTNSSGGDSNSTSPEKGTQTLLPSTMDTAMNTADQAMDSVDAGTVAAEFGIEDEQVALLK